jgi:tRNA(Ile)-lysidine synthase
MKPLSDQLSNPDAGDALFRPMQKARGIVLAVSGGPDSVALMLLAAKRAAQGGLPPLHVASVDHGLRTESADEIVLVAQWSRALGLPHHALVWEGPKPHTRIQEKAREARYELLEECAIRLGADVLVSGHHADDQAETVLFRLVRGSGIGGLAGMAREVQRGKITHHRPLLDIPKAELVAFCEAHNHPYIIDPSNENQSYARARLRRLAPLLEREGLDRAALLRLARRAASAENALSQQLEDLLERTGTSTAKLAKTSTTSTPQSTSVAHLIGLNHEMLARFLAAHIDALRESSSNLLRLDRLEAFAARLAESLQNGAGISANLGGVLITLKDKKLTFAPEPLRQRGRSTGKI